MPRLWSLFVFFGCVSLALADFPTPKKVESTDPFRNVRVWQYELSEPRPIRAWAIRIDLSDPDTELVVSPRAKVQDGFETASETTVAFAESERVQVAINGGPFEPLRSKSNEPMRINGLHLSRGDLISPGDAHKSYAAILFDGGQKPTIRHYPLPKNQLGNVRNAIGGFSIVLANGENKMTYRPPNEDKHPRTAIGYSDEGRYLWLLIVDGRQPTASEGMSYFELGEWSKSLGISDLLNLDGGGSTTLVIQNPTSQKYEVANSPVGRGTPGSLRQVGNNLGVRIYSQPGDLTSAQVRAIMPRLSADRARLFLGPLNRTLTKYKIDNPARRSAFLAQLAHESGELKYMEEIASGEAYEGRKSLGNTEPGDGKRFKGRGPIQLTGRANYRKAGTVLGLDLEEHPERVADPEIGCQVSGWFWESRGLNELADAGDFKLITKRINGGFNGLTKREAYYDRAKQVLQPEKKSP